MNYVVKYVMLDGRSGSVTVQADSVETAVMAGMFQHPEVDPGHMRTMLVRPLKGDEMERVNGS